MAERNPNESINKKELEAILEVNRKSIEIRVENASQNEEIIALLEEVKSEQTESDEKISELKKIAEKIEKDVFKLQVLLASGILSLIIQIIQMFTKK